MPYDPTDARATLDADRLTVHVVGGSADPDCTYELARTDAGRVAVRAYPAPGTPDEYEADADALLDRFERAARDGRRLSVELHALRHWLRPGA